MATTPDSAATDGDPRLVALGLDLHDGPLQEVAFLVGHLRALAERIAEGAERDELLESVHELEAVLGDLDRDLRTLVSSLTSGEGAPAADDTLEEVIAAFERRSGIAVAAAVGDVGALPVPERRALVQVAREALANVLKHSGASSVRVTAVVDAAGARLEVEDDGAGLDETAQAAAGRHGLNGMATRMRLAGGTCEIRRTAAGGTLVTAHLPGGRG